MIKINKIGWLIIRVSILIGFSGCNNKNNTAKYQNLILFVDSLDKSKFNEIFSVNIAGGPGDYIYKGDTPELFKSGNVNYIKMVGRIDNPTGFVVVFKGIESSVLILERNKSLRDLNGIPNIHLKEKISDRLLLLGRRT